MPKFNKPKVNKSQFDDRPNQTKSLVSESELPSVQLDETIVAGRRPKPQGDLQRLLAEVPELRGGVNLEMFPHIPETSLFNEKQFAQKTSKILGAQNINVSIENLVNYLEYLKKNLKIPCQVTAIEEFEWEEEYTMGSGSKKEYAKLKKTQPSYTDNFTINQLDDFVVREYGIFTKVQRVSDSQKFILPLAQLQCVDVISPNHRLLYDYSLWYISY